MNLNALEIYIEVMHVGSFVDVAKARNVAPSSISRAISGLEKELGVKLFQRTTRKISATDAGRAYFAKVFPLLSELTQAAESASDLAKLPQGSIKITSSVSFGHHVIVPLIGEFMHEYPDITIDYLLTDSTIDIIGEKIDVALRHGTLHDSSLIASKLIQTEYRIVASPTFLKSNDSIANSEAISEHPVLTFDIPQFKAQWILQKGRRAQKVPITPRHIISNALSLKELTLAGAGISLLANWLVDEDIQSRRLIQLFPEYGVYVENYDSSIHVVTPSRDYVPKRTRLFIEFIKRRLQEKKF